MKYLAILFFIPAAWSSPVRPENGLYRCLTGNHESICDQSIRGVMKAGELVSMRVMYEGFCNGQGPYEYDCEDGVCTDWTIKITFEDEKHYRWENLGHDFRCEMEKVSGN